MRPGVDVISRALPPPLNAPTDTGVAFIIGATAGASDPPYALLRSLTDFVAVYGARGSGATQATYDAVDVYFREGGSECYVASTTSTVVPTAAAMEPPDEDSLKKMSRSELDALAIEFGYDPEQYETKADVIAAISQGEAPELLAADAGITKALGNLSEKLGPGQVFIADPTLAAVLANQSALLAHAATTNRVALLTCADGTAATIIAAGQALQTDANARYGALFAPSAIVPGVTPGTTRTVPYAAVQAGIIARNDAQYTANQPAAGVLGQSIYSLDIAAHYTDIDHSNFLNASVNGARLLYGGVRTYGYRACVDATKVPQWTDFGWARLNMEIAALADVIGENYVFSQLDGRGRTIASFEGDLSAMLAPYFNAGALYGATAPEAFQVDTGDAVNTPTTIANGELHAIISVRMSGMAEWVVIEIVKYATNQSLPAAAVPA